MATSNSWNSVFQVGSHHLAREFLKMGYNVAFISDPISPFHLFTNSFKERFDLYRSGGFHKNNLWSYVPATLVPPHNKPFLCTQWVHNNWQRLTLPSVVGKAKHNGFGEVDMLYLDTPLQSFWLNKIKASKTVYRMADQNSGFKKATTAQIEMEQKLIQNVDLVVCTAKTLADSIQGKAKKVHHLPNGVHLAHFKKAGTKPPEYQKIPSPIAIYVGALEYWFDFELAESLAKEMPHISFVFIGPVKNKTPTLKNIHFLGPRPYSEIPSYLQFADVGLILFDVNRYPELIHHVNPLKLYEYIASGLPVVATRWRELENINSPALLSVSCEEFKANVLKALQTKDFEPDPFTDTLDWSKKAAQLIDFLR